MAPRTNDDIHRGAVNRVEHVALHTAITSVKRHGWRVMTRK